MFAPRIPKPQSPAPTPAISATAASPARPIQRIGVPPTRAKPFPPIVPGGGALFIQRMCAECEKEKEDKESATLPISPKLLVGSSSDPLEREADRVADQVMSPAPPQAAPGPEHGTRGPAQPEERGAADLATASPAEVYAAALRRWEQAEHARAAERLRVEPYSPPLWLTEWRAARNREAAEARERQAAYWAQSPARSPGVVQRMCAECAKEKEEREGTIQRRETSATPATTSDAPSVVHNVLRSGGGAPLDPAMRSDLEPKLGVDLGEVRVHTGSQAAESARAIHARAYTSGTNVVFGAGQYAPHTSDGKRLLAHELAHVVQQSAAGKSHPVSGLVAHTSSPPRLIQRDDLPEKKAHEQAYPLMLDGKTASAVVVLAKKVLIEMTAAGVGPLAGVTGFLIVHQGRLYPYSASGVLLATKTAWTVRKDAAPQPGVYIYNRTNDKEYEIGESSAAQFGWKPVTQATKLEIWSTATRDEVNALSKPGSLGTGNLMTIIAGVRDAAPGTGQGTGAGGAGGMPAWVLTLVKQAQEQLKKEKEAVDAGESARAALLGKENVVFPSRLVPWTDGAGDDFKAHVNVFLGKAHRPLRLQPTESPAELANRVLDTTQRIARFGSSAARGTTESIEEDPNPGEGVPKDPPFPAQIVGNDIQAAGGTGVLTMKVMWAGTGSLVGAGTVASAYNGARYRWERYDITKLVEQGRSSPDVDELQRTLRNAPISEISKVGPGEAIVADAKRRVNEQIEDARSSLSGILHPASHGEGIAGAAGNVTSNFVNFQFQRFSAVISWYGFLVSSAQELAGDEREEHSVTWPREGFYLVRCIAYPHPVGDRRRKPSVAVRVIEARKSDWIARDTLQRGEADIAQLKLRILTEPNEKRRAQLMRDLDDLLRVNGGSAWDTVKLALEKKEEELKHEGDATATKKLEGERDKIQEHLAFVEQREKRFGGRIYRPKVAFASEVTGSTYPLLVQLGRAPDGKRWVVSDVTTPDGEIVEAGGTGDSAAIESAFRLFAGKNKYGTGTLAVELPASLGTSSQILSLRNAPRDAAVTRKRLDDLLLILTTLSMLVPGVGQTLSPALLALGAGLAAARLIERMKTDRLRLDEELVSDLLTVLAAAATGVAKGALAIGALRFQAGQKAFLIFREGVSAEKVTRALAALDSVADASAQVAKVLDAAGMAWGDLSALGQFAEVEEQERTGKLTHAEARMQRAQAFFSALQNHGFFLHGLHEAMAAHEEAKARKAGAHADAATHPAGAEAHGPTVRTRDGQHEIRQTAEGPQLCSHCELFSKVYAGELAGNGELRRQLEEINGLSEDDPQKAAKEQDLQAGLERERKTRLKLFYGKDLAKLQPDATDADLAELTTELGVDNMRAMIAKLQRRTALNVGEQLHMRAERLRASPGVTNPSPITAGKTVIIPDSNALTGYELRSTTPQHRASAFTYIHGQVASGAEVRVSTVVAAETPLVGAELPVPAAGAPPSREGFSLAKDRKSAEYKAVLAVLEQHDLGGAGTAGAMDRLIVADALFADTPAAPVFVTGDASVAMGLAEIVGYTPKEGKNAMRQTVWQVTDSSGVVHQGSSKEKALQVAFSNRTFDVTIGGRTIKVRLTF